MQPNYSNVLFCSAFQAPRWPPSARSSSVNVSHRLSMETPLVWMYLLYFNMGLLNEMMTLKDGMLLTAVFSTSVLERWFCTYVAELVHRRSKKNLISCRRYYALISHAGLWWWHCTGRRRASCRNIFCPEFNCSSVSDLILSSCKFVSPGFKLCTCWPNTVFLTNQLPVRRLKFRCDDQRETPLLVWKQWRLLKRLA